MRARSWTRWWTGLALAAIAGAACTGSGVGEAGTPSGSAPSSESTSTTDAASSPSIPADGGPAICGTVSAHLPVTASIVGYVVDASASMATEVEEGGSSRLDATRSAVLGCRGCADYVGLSRYPEADGCFDSARGVPIGPNTTAQRAAIEDALGALAAAHGGAPLSDALSFAFADVERAAAGVNARPRPRMTVVLITDGTLADEPVCASAPPEDSELLAEVARASEQGVNLLVLGLPGIEGDSQRLRTLVDASSGMGSAYVQLSRAGSRADCTTCAIEGALMNYLKVWVLTSCDIEVKLTEGEADFESGEVVLTLTDDSSLRLAADQWDIDQSNPELPVLRLLGAGCQLVDDRAVRSITARFPCAGQGL